MAGVVPWDLKRLFAGVRSASSRGPAKAKLFVEDMVQVGEDVSARRNHRLTQIMQLCPRSPTGWRRWRRPSASGSVPR